MADRGARRQTEVDQTDDAVQNAKPGPSVAERKRIEDVLQNAQPGPRAAKRKRTETEAQRILRLE
jgi:hypothetical protein